MIGQAIADFSMIRDGDKIAVGLSGGKDSAFLLRSLCCLRKRSPVSFTVEAITVDPTEGRDVASLSAFAKFCGVAHRVIRHPIFQILEKSATDSPCSLCANLRRGILASNAAGDGCTSLALGHHRDDVVETVFLNLMYGGKFRCFHPNMLMTRSGVRVIRPLVYVPEAAITERAEKLNLPLVNFCCGYEASSMRAYVKASLRMLSRKAPNLPNNILHALKNMKYSDGWTV
ncbi:MAG: tRNA 2-thiocytidine(32) synthetase TtcA [Synergistaceae bacterium]|jgi:tRNA(Ile)-lysidine synthase TilS/MesJ|nr:tRNA 2-thiocytidine(32) synthetase TtcA [Synergistaceae bacterium]